MSTIAAQRRHSRAPQDGTGGRGPTRPDGVEGCELALVTTLPHEPATARRAVSGAPDRPRFVLVGGIPGAGKTTALEAVAAVRPDATTIDPDRIRRRLAALLPAAVPYRSYRALVHLLSTLLLLAVLLRGPTSRRRPLLVHDPATRRSRRTITGRLARRRGWEPVLVLVDVTRGTALAGQRDRRRILSPRAFDRHWRRWQRERPRLAALAHEGRGEGPWSTVVVVDRETAARSLSALVV